MASNKNDVDCTIELVGSKSSDNLSMPLKMAQKKNSCPPNICNGKSAKFKDLIT